MEKSKSKKSRASLYEGVQYLCKVISAKKLTKKKTCNFRELDQNKTLEHTGKKGAIIKPQSKLGPGIFFQKSKLPIKNEFSIIPLGKVIQFNREIGLFSEPTCGLDLFGQIVQNLNLLFQFILLKIFFSGLFGKILHEANQQQFGAFHRPKIIPKMLSVNVCPPAIN